jgi:exodeoxyribonuclease VII small subunit
MTEPLPDGQTFEQSLAELELVIRDLEDGQPTLEESITRCSRGILLIKRCYDQLSEAEQRIQLLLGQDEEGRPVLRPFDHTPSHGPEKPAEQRRPGQPDGFDDLF